jgi:4'-phosphopantetheinyl transferase
MPVFKTIKPNLTTQILVWEITESFDALFGAVTLNPRSQLRLQSMKSEMHQKGFLSVRKLLQVVGYSDLDLYYDASGKPHLADDKHISISHSHGFSAIIISDQEVGIDLEILKEKVLRIAPKFMDVSHLQNLSHKDQIKKATIIWGIKEAIFKIKNQKGISFQDHIFESEFDLLDQKTVAQLRFNTQIEDFEIHFQEIKGYILVWATQG